MEKKEFGYVPPRFLVDRIARFRRWGKFKTRIDLEILRRRFDMETGKSKFKIGDVVRLRSDSQDMTVRGFGVNPPQVSTVCYSNGTFVISYYEEDVLVMVKPLEEKVKAVTVYDLIFEERERIVEKWGVQEHSAAEWLVVLMEEVGEASQALLQGRIEDAKTELIQCAAVIVSMFDDLGWMVDETGA